VLPTAPTSTAPDPGCARCPLTHGEPNNQRRRGHWVQPVTWVPASICVREKPNGNSFCRAPVGAGQPNPPTTTQQETRPRSGPPSSWANQSPKMTTTAPFGAGHQGEPTSRWTCTEDTGRSPGPSGQRQASGAQRRPRQAGSGKRQASAAAAAASVRRQAAAAAAAASVRRTTAAAAASVRRTTAATASGKRQDVNGGHGSGKRQDVNGGHGSGKRQRQAATAAASGKRQDVRRTTAASGRVQASGKAAAVKRRRAGWWAGPSPLLGKRKSVVQLS